MFFEVDLKEDLKNEIEIIAKQYGFKDIDFCTYYESGRSISNLQARTKNPQQITFSILSLYPISEVYKISPEIAKKMVEVICLHERVHYTFPNPFDANEWDVQERSSRMYKDYKEFVKLDSLLLFFPYRADIKDEEFKQEILEYVSNFKRLTVEDKQEIVEGLVDIKNAKKAKFFRKRRIKNKLENFLRADAN